jgi:mRNA-degrading endonuclease RelE of RelBE toxin-antitoxin system
MSFSVIPSDKFKKEAKRLVKKYPSLKAELAELNDTLANSPELGTPLGSDTYKIRLFIKSKGKGKSGGGRVITYGVKNNREVYLLTIYDKSEYDSVDDKTLKNIIQSLSYDDQD